MGGGLKITTGNDFQIDGMLCPEASGIETLSSYSILYDVKPGLIEVAGMPGCTGNLTAMLWFPGGIILEFLICILVVCR